MKRSCILAVLLLCMTACGTEICSASVRNCPGISKEYDEEYESNYRKKTYTSGQYSNGQYKEYYNAYDANYRVKSYTHIVKKLCKVVNYTAEMKINHCYPTICVTKGTSIAETSASSHSVGAEASVEAKTSFKLLKNGMEAGIKITGSYSYTHTNSTTTTYDDTETYSVTLDEASKVGKYYWAAMRDYDAYEVQVLRRNLYSVNTQWYVGDTYTIYPSVGDDDYYYQLITPDDDLSKYK